MVKGQKMRRECVVTHMPHRINFMVDYNRNGEKLVFHETRISFRGRCTICAPFFTLFRLFNQFPSRAVIFVHSHRSLAILS